MFQSKKGPTDSYQRFTDLRKEAPSRAKHLRNALQGLSAYERRGLLEQCSVEAFHLFSDLLAWAGAASSARGAAELLELALYTLEQLLLHLPDLVGQKWHFNAIGTALRRFLHPHNDPLLRRRALKLFIYWYQILGVSKHGPDLPDLDALFQLLVPHFPHPDGRNTEQLLLALCEGPPTPLGPIQPPKATPLLPTADKAAAQSQALQEFLESLLKSLSYVANVEWPHKKQYYQLKSFRFLLSKLEQYFIPTIFPSLDKNLVNLARGEGRLPSPSAPVLPKASLPMNDPLVICKYCVVRWLNLYTLSYKSADSLGQSIGLASECESPRPGAPASNKLPTSYALIRGVLFESLPNTDLTLSILREGLLLPLQLDRVIQRIVRTLREWLFQEVKGPWEEAEGLSEPVREDAATRALVEVLGWWYWNPYLGDEWPHTLRATLSINSKILALLKDLASPQRPPPIQLTRESWAVILRTLLGMVGRAIPAGPEAGELAKAIATPLFQTLLITWVLGAAVCRVPVGAPLWDALRDLLAPRAAWPQLLDEWAKVMESSTRALGTSVYRVDLLNAPLDRKRGHEQIKSGTRVAIRKEALSRTDTKPESTTAPPSQSPTPRDGDHIDFCEPILPELAKRGSVVAASPSSSSSPPTSGVEEGSSKPGDQSHHSSHKSHSSTAWTVSEHSGSEADQSLDSANPESISIGGETSSIHSADFGALVNSDRESEKTSLFNERPEHTPSPELEEELTEGEEEAVEDDVELTPRLADGEDSGSLWASVWCRIFGCLGSFEDIGMMNGKAMRGAAGSRLKAVKALGKILGMLLRIADNQGIPDERQPADGRPLPPCELSPPQALLAPILLRLASETSKDLGRSREEAVKLLCKLLVGRRLKLEPELRAQFYACLHRCLEDGVAGAADEMLSHVSRHVLSDPHLELLGDALSNAEQVLHSQLSGEVLAHAARCLACFATIPPGFPLASDTKSVQVREQASRALIRVLALSSARVTPEALTSAINGLAMMLHLQETYRDSSARPDSLSHDSLDALLTCLRNRQPWTGILVVQAISPLLHLPHSQHTTDIVEAFVDVLENQRALDDASSLCQRMISELCEWLEQAREASETNRHLTESVLWALAACCDDKASSGVQAAASAGLLSLSRHLAQFPLPQFALAAPGSQESELSLQPADELFTSLGSRHICSVLTPATAPACPQLLLLSRSQAGRSLWSLRKKGSQTQDSELSKGDQMLAKLKESAPVAQPPLDSQDVEPEDTRLRELLNHLKTTSPELSLGQEEPSSPTQLPHESDIRTALETLNLQSTSSKTFPGRSSRSNRSGRLWSSFLGDLGLSDSDFVQRLTPIGGDTGSSPSAQIARRLKHLDTQLTRNVHKMAVIYVAAGQEDKDSVLRNVKGSEAFEEFVRGLGWEVEVGGGGHHGYAGGLTAGNAAYYATLTTETLFHVSTHLGSDPHHKLRHLGNDEIHIIWSENEREYRRSLIPTDFCDVLIIIYPLGGAQFRIQLSSKEGDLVIWSENEREYRRSLIPTDLCDVLIIIYPLGGAQFRIQLSSKEGDLVIWSENEREYRRSLIPTDFCDVLIIIYPLGGAQFRIQLSSKECVLVIWSENDREYRRSLIPTDFCDVLIIIYPLGGAQFRIQLSSKEGDLVIWSENEREYRRSLIPTDFCDVLIIIYPLGGAQFRIQLSSKEGDLVIWSENEREYRRSLIPTDFCDVLIIIYPLGGAQFRIQLSSKEGDLVIWSENEREYRRSLIPTDFCDVLIIIYPLGGAQFRIQLSSKEGDLVIWSENEREYRRSLIPTDFCDVLIIIYPLGGAQFRIQLSSKEGDLVIWSENEREYRRSLIPTDFCDVLIIIYPLGGAQFRIQLSSKEGDLVIWSENEREYRRSLIPTDFCDVLIIIYPLGGAQFRIQLSSKEGDLVIWSENEREYRRSLIPTDFCDVLIIIYPLGGAQFRIQLSSKEGDLVIWSENEREYRRSLIPTDFCDVLIIIYPLGGAQFRIQLSSKEGDLVIWSENEREYRRSLIPTDFCDVLIIIYPLGGAQFRIQLSSKECVELGPLVDGMVVSGRRLAALVRTTALNASDALRRRRSAWLPAHSQRLAAITDLTGPSSSSSSLAPLLLRLLHANQSSHAVGGHTRLITQASAPVNV